MPEDEQQQLMEKLEKFSEVLRKRTNEFRQTGRFSDHRRNFAGLIEKQNDALRAKVSQAARSRNSWAFAKAELWRDYEAMVNEFITLDDSIDADALRKS